MIWWVKPNHNTCCSHTLQPLWPVILSRIEIWAASWQNQQNGMCVQRRLILLVLLWGDSFTEWNHIKSCYTGISAITQSNQMVTNTQNNKMACAPSKDSDQPGHPPPPSLIRVFAVRMKKAWVLSYPLSTQRRLIRLGVCPRSTWVFTGRTVILLVLSWGGSYFNHYIYRNIDDIV